MKLTQTALGLILALGAMPAAAQYGPSSSPPQSTAVQPSTETKSSTADTGYKPTVSKQARAEIVALQTAVTAKNTAAIPAAAAAARAKAKTKDDQYIIARLLLTAAVDANDTAAMRAGVEEVIATGVLPAADMMKLYRSLGKLDYDAKAYDKASVSLERVLQMSPNDLDTLLLLGETRNGQGRTADSVALFQKAIALKLAAGQKPEESWYRRPVALSFNARLPIAPAVARDWASAYPSPKNWRDAISIFRVIRKPNDEQLLDSLRLSQAAGALAGEEDYYRFANLLMNKGYSGEAKTVLDQGFAANQITKGKEPFGQLYSVATTKSQGDRASLAATAKTALAGAAVRPVMVTADAYYGYGDYAEAAALYRAALGKSGADKDLANLHLGMALARSGDKAGAIAALNAAGGAQAEIAKLWLAYLSTKA